MRLFPHPSPSQQRQTREATSPCGDGKASRRELAPPSSPRGAEMYRNFPPPPPMPHTQLGASHAKPAPPRWALLEPHGGYMLNSLALTDGDANGVLAQWPRPAPPRFGIGTGLCALDGPLISVRLPVADPLPPPSGKVFFFSLSLLVTPGGTGSLASWPTHRVFCIGEYVRGGSLRTVEASRRVPRRASPPVDFIRPSATHPCTSGSGADDIMASAYTTTVGAIS